jgi:hypothetical protein
MKRPKSTPELQAELENANGYIEELETKLDSIAGIASADENEEDEESDSDGRRPGLTNPARGPWRKDARHVTDRALRYRANACPPPGPRICCLCGSRRTVEIGHVNGHEEDTAPPNLFFTCRACNVRCGNTLRNAGLGRLTRQFNPSASGANSLGQWLTAVTSMKGESTAMPVAGAVEMIRATPPNRRSEFAREIWEKRRAQYGPSGRSDGVPF